MKNNFEEVDRFSREALSEWEAPPPAHIADKIHKRLFWFNLWRNPYIRSLKVILPLLLIVSGSIAIGIYVFKSDLNLKKVAEIQFDSDMASPHHLPANNALKNNPSSNLTVGQNINNNLTTPTDNSVSQNSIQNNIAQNTNDDNINGPSGKQTVNTNSTNDQVYDINTDAAYASGEKNSESPNQKVIIQEANSAYLSIKPIPVIVQNQIFFGSTKSLDKNISTVYKFRKKPTFSLQLGISPLFARIGDQKQEGIESSPKMLSGSANLLFDYHIKNFYIETGLQYCNLQTQQKGKDLLYNPHDLFTQTLTGQELQIDTGGYWHYKYIQDSVIHIFDSSWVNEYDTSYNNIFGNVISRVNDTLKESIWKTSISLIEIPLAVGYRFYLWNTELSVKGGVLIGFWTRKKGFTYLSESSSGIVSIDELYTRKGMQYSYFLAATISRQWNENWSVVFTPSYRGSINGLKGTEGVSSHPYSAWGIGLGVRYEF